MVLVSDNSVSQINAALQSANDNNNTKLKNALYNADAIKLGISRTQEEIVQFNKTLDRTIDAYTQEYVDSILDPLDTTVGESGKFITSLKQENGLVSGTNRPYPQKVAHGNPGAYMTMDSSRSTWFNLSTFLNPVVSTNISVDIPPYSFFWINAIFKRIRYNKSNSFISITPTNMTWNRAYHPTTISMSEFETYFTRRTAREYHSGYQGHRYYYDLYGFGDVRTVHGDVVFGSGYHETLSYPISGYSGEYSIDNVNCLFSNESIGVDQYIENNGDVDGYLFYGYETQFEGL